MNTEPTTEERIESDKLAMEQLAHRCREFLKTYDEFYPDHAVDLMKDIEGIVIALQAWENLP